MNEELTYFLLQAGDNVEKRGAYNPPPQQDIQHVVDRNRGIKQQYNMDRQLNNDVETKRIQPGGSAESIIVQRARFNRWKRKYFWLEHHLLCNKKKGRCRSENCPGLNRVLTDRVKKIKEPLDTRYQCMLQCSLQFASPTHFCDNEYGRSGQIRNCHDLYHTKNPWKGD